MSVDILLPCVRFEVAIHPSDPNQPTDLEAAALYFIQHLGEPGADFDQLEMFLGLGKAVVAEMMIRFVNRGWVTIGGAATRLHLSGKAEEAMARSPEERGKALASTDDGRRFWLCYDLIGGGVAAIPRQYLTRSGEDPRAAPRRPSKENANDYPYGRHIQGFLPSNPNADDPELRAWILRALLADRNARQYFRGELDRRALHVRILPPGRKLGLEDIWFCKCAFDVIPLPDDGEGEIPPLLRCIETRNRQIRKLGELNSGALVELAQGARQGGDERFWKTLKKHAAGDSSIRSAPADPLQNLREQVQLAEKDADFEDLYELWEQVKERIATTLASRIDFDDSRVTKAEKLRPDIANAIDQARQRIVLISTVIRASSPELSGSGDTLSALVGVPTGPDAPLLLVHGVRPAAPHGPPLSDETAVARLATALGSRRVHVVSNEQDHMRTSFLLCDADTLLFFSGDFFGGQRVYGILLRTAPVFRATGTFGRMVVDLPPELRERIELPSKNTNLGLEGERTHSGEASSAEVNAALAEIEALLAHAKGVEEQDSESYRQLLDDLDRQMAWLAHWVEAKSESVEVLVGQKIRDTTWRILQDVADDESLFVGIAGRMDSRAVIELREAIGLRLSRQDLLDGDRAETVVCLPRLAEFDDIAMKLEEDFRPVADKTKLLRTARRDGIARPVGFVATPSTAVLAHDGLIQFRPTVGRRIKGTHLGLCLRGPRARALALEFVYQAWPDCAQALPNPDRVDQAKDLLWPITERRKGELRGLAQLQRWFDDGNGGAYRARESIQETGDDSVWSRVEAEAESLWAGDDQDKRIAYALTKAAAIAELNGHSGQIGALARLALHARSQGDLMVTALLAEYLPLESVFRDALVRKLAFCLARRRAPQLTPDETSQLASPSTAIHALSSLLMLDGLGGELPNWLAYVEPPAVGDEVAGFTKALASYLQKVPGERPLDLRDADAEKGEIQLDSAIARLKEIVSHEINRTFKQEIAESVRVMHEVLFRSKNSFVVDLHQLLNQEWAGLDEVKRMGRLIAIVNGSASDLKVDLLAANGPNDEKINLDKLVESYYDKKHQRMQRETGLEPVKLHLSGRRYALRSLRTIFGSVMHDLVPGLLGQRTHAEMALIDAAREVLRSDRREGGTEVDWLWMRVKERLRRPEASMELFSQPWLLPLVTSTDTPHWPKLEAGYFAAEFEKSVSFHEVVEWFLGDYRGIELDGQVAGGTIGDKLLTLHELLEKLTAEIEPNDLVKAEGILVERLREIASSAREQAKRTKDLIEFTSESSDGPYIAVQAVTVVADRLEESIRNEDIVTAVLTSTELVEVLRNLELERQKAVVAAQNKLGKDRSDPEREELGRLFRVRTADAETLRAARRYLDLGPRFRKRRIETNAGLLLDIVDGREVPDGVAGGAEGLVRAMAAALPDGTAELGDWSENDISAALCGFMSELDISVLLPLARLEDGIWRVRTSHPAMTSLAIGDSREVEFLIPTTWDAEARLRDEQRRKSFVPASSGTLAGLVAGGGPAQFGAGRPGRTRVLISLFYNVSLPGTPTLPWRRLAEIAGLGIDDRRVGVLSLLAGQQIGSAERLKQWWDKKYKAEGIAHLLGIQIEQLSTRTSDAELARVAVDFCLIFHIGFAASGNDLSLSERCIGALSRLWPAADLDGTHDPTAITLLLNQIVSATTTSSQRGLDLGISVQFGSTG